MRDITLWGPNAPVFDLMVKIAAGEVQAQSRRTTSWHQLMSKHGTVRCRPPFGMKAVVSKRTIENRVAPFKEFAPDWDPRPELDGRSRAELVLSAVDAMMAGESATTVARRWNAEGLSAGRGGNWSAGAITRILRSPKLAGVAHRGTVLLDVRGDEVPAGYELEAELSFVNEPLISFHDWFEVQRMLAGRPNASNRRVANERALRGLVSCGRCTFRMESTGSAIRCARSHYVEGGCGGNTVTRTALEAWVIEAALGLVKNPELRLAAAAANEPTRASRITALESDAARLMQRLSRLTDAYADFDETMGPAAVAALAQFEEKKAAVKRDLARVHSEIRKLHQQSRRRLSEALSKADDVDAEWAAMPVHRQNSILHELIEKVWVDPVVKRSNEVDTNRFRLVWATD